MVAGLVQSKAQQFISAPSLAFPSNVQAGDTIVVFATQNTTTAPVLTTSGTATFSTALTLVTSITAGATTHKRGSSLYYAVVSAAGSCTISFTLGGTVTTISIEEWSGLTSTPLDSTVAASAANTGTTPSVTSGTTTNAYDLIISAVGSLDAGESGASAPYILDPGASQGNTSSSGNIEFRSVNATGAYASGWPFAATDWDASIAAFKTTFIAALAKPILQAVNRSNTY